MAEDITIDPLAGLSKPWQKFFKKFEEIDDPALKVSQWKDVHVLAYICKVFKERYNREFSITIKGAPSRCPDMYLTKRIIASLGTTNMRTIQEYIKWVYDYKSKKPFRSIGFFLTAGFANEFKDAKEKQKKNITRSTELPSAFVTIAKELNVEAKTYGDLIFIKKSIDRNNDTTSNYYLLLQNLQLLGLDLDKLSSIGD